MKEINYLEIIKKSWFVTWNNRYLWWFGLFLVLGGGMNFNLTNNGEWNNKIGENSNRLESLISQHWKLIIVLAISVVIAGLILFVLSLIAKAGLIKSLDKIEKKTGGSFMEGFGEGKKYFWKILLVGIILGFLILAVVVILGVPVALLFSLNSPILAILAAFLAIFIFIPLIILAVFIGKYSIFYIVLSDLEIRDSLENGYQVFRKNILPSIIMSLFFIPISIVIFILAISALLIIGLVFLLVGAILYLMLAKTGIIIAVSLGGLFFVVLLVLLNSVYQVFSQSVWFLFFREIASLEEEEKAEEAAVNIVEKTIPAPEEA
jgi:MFS family permease